MSSVLISSYVAKSGLESEERSLKACKCTGSVSTLFTEKLLMLNSI